jgi:uncharacterized NAD(P)/FAD-binding protein YdhS
MASKTGMEACPARDRDGTIAIVGAGFSGTALAYRLLRAGEFRGRVVLIERSGRFGPGLAYGSASHGAVLNVPAGNMSLDERAPSDFVDFVRSEGLEAAFHDFVPRHLYGRYLASRLESVARQAGAGRLLRVSGEATRLARESTGFWITIDADHRLFADRVVLAVGHSPPATLPALSPLEGTPVYVSDPWSTLPACRPGGRVLIIGTGLTMADVVVELVNRPGGPSKIVAVSRHGRLPHVRDAVLVRRGRESRPVSPLGSRATVRSLLVAARHAVRVAETHGGNWRDVIAGLRDDAAELWACLPLEERRRFLRHVQPHWDVHRHLLPPQVGATVHAALRERRLELRAGRIVAAESTGPGACVTVQPRGGPRRESLHVDQVILCTGPLADPTRNPSRLVRSLVHDGWLTADATVCGLRVDTQGRPIDATGLTVDGIFYLGPWLRARDWEATAVSELRRAATALTRALLHDIGNSRAKHCDHLRRVST